ncbi:MAG: class Ib ribonucleoside-diphosphate reductase assembly flavoprotein NrdI [Culicoidibacterales bacterium]
MKIVYYSQTGNVKRFVDRLKWQDDVLAIDAIDGCLEEDFIIVTGTTNFGETPAIVDTFLQQNKIYLKAVAASGNRNWGDLFAKAADNIANEYNVPILVKFELSGFNRDIDLFKAGVEQLEISRIK